MKRVCPECGAVRVGPDAQKRMNYHRRKNHGRRGGQ